MEDLYLEQLEEIVRYDSHHQLHKLGIVGTGGNGIFYNSWIILPEKYNNKNYLCQSFSPSVCLSFCCLSVCHFLLSHINTSNFKCHISSISRAQKMLKVARYVPQPPPPPCQVLPAQGPEHGSLLRRVHPGGGRLHAGRAAGCSLEDRSSLCCQRPGAVHGILSFLGHRSVAIIKKFTSIKPQIYEILWTA